jgi:hypothetical protein
METDEVQRLNKAIQAATRAMQGGGQTFGALPCRLTADRSRQRRHRLTDVAAEVGNRGDSRGEQRVDIDDRQPPDELARVAADEHHQRAEACRPRALHEIERALLRSHP